MKIVISELDIDILYRVARGMSYKQIALAEGIKERRVTHRMAVVRKAFGATTMPNLIAVLIASDVLRLQDLYQDIDVYVREHRRDRKGAVYSLQTVRV